MGRWYAVALVLALTVAASGCSILKPDELPSETYLRGDKYTRMLVEIDYQAGKAPRAEAVNLLKSRILERCNKPDGVQVDQGEVQLSQAVWTNEELVAAEKQFRDRHSADTTAVLYILYVGGGYQGDTSSGKVIGVRYTRSSIAIFKDTLDQAASPVNTIIPLFTASDLERSVIVHEFGHALGLVNLETKMVTPHEDTSDPSRKGHSNNKDSVMYWAIESDAIRSVFTGPPPTDFDANDKADLRAAGGK